MINIEPRLVGKYIAKPWRSKFEKCGKCKKDLNNEHSFIGIDDENAIVCSDCPQKFCVEHAEEMEGIEHERHCANWRTETLKVFEEFKVFNKEMIPLKPVKSILRLFNARMTELFQSKLDIALLDKDPQSVYA